MNKDWNDPKIIIGNAATNNYYFHREWLADEIWQELVKGNHVIISAPRRMGKTSLMQYMEANPKEKTKVVFKNIQGIKSEEEFYQMLYTLLVEIVPDKDKLIEKIRKAYKEIKIESIGADGVSLEKSKFNYKVEIDKIIEIINKSTEEKIILLIDELPEVLFKIAKNGKEDEAANIITKLRSWRQNNITSNIQMAFSGSVGIEYVVQYITGRVSDINDLKIIHFEPFDKEEAKSYLKWATDDSTIEFSDEIIAYFITKVEYGIPYYYNLMLDKINKIAKRRNQTGITVPILDEAFSNIMADTTAFVDWKNRLSDYLPPHKFTFVNKVLKHIAHNQEISIQAIYNLASESQLEEEYMTLINDLKKDGYVVEKNKKYVFLSPFLASFWKNINPVYDGK